MLIVLHDKELSAVMDWASERFSVDAVFDVDGPVSMERHDERIGDLIEQGQSVLLVVPTHALAVTYALIEECKKMAPVWQLKASQRR